MALLVRTSGTGRGANSCGRAGYGFRIDDGVASFIRIENAVIVLLEVGA